MAVVPTFDACMVDLDGLQFTFYTPDQIRKLSVKHITCPVCFTDTGEAVVSGPHDPALGPIERLVGCVTCGLDESGCPGHFGHIDLPLPAYNPFFFNFMFKILRSVCLNCFNFRLSQTQIDRYFAAFTFLRCGELFKALDIHLATTKEKDMSELAALAQEKLVKEAQELRRKMDIKKLKTYQVTKNEHVIYQQVLDQFMSALHNAKACNSCGSRSPKLKQEGRSKIFLLPFTDKEVSLNNLNGTIPCSLLSGLPLGQKQFREYMTQLEVMKILEKLWMQHHGLLDLIGGGTGLGMEGYKAYFFEVLPVLPNRYRPFSLGIGGNRLVHNQTTLNIKVINTVLDIRSIGASENEASPSKKESALIEETVNKWNELQNTVDQIVEGGTYRANGSGILGIKQFLEKKEGLFRKHMMGKRVNFAARSTISPDVNLGVGEVGLPAGFAKTLSFPEKVTQWNYNELRKLIERGPHELPGAVAVENDKGVIIDLAYLTEPRRKALARRLYVHKDPMIETQDDFSFRNQPSGGVKTVYRHLKNGDMVLTNRQPTLHKASLMAHKVRILPEERTIRFHYANCASFNADFDGDEMNVHFPQDNMSRAEGYGILHAHHQYLSPSNGAPLRGLIQDNIGAGTVMSSKETFFQKGDYTQLLVTALARRFDAQEGTQGQYLTERMCKKEDECLLEVPALLKPARLWTGKQVISTVIGNLAKGMPPLTTSFKCRTPADVWGDSIESQVVFRQGFFLTGVLDKSSYGRYGLIHGCQEIYGNEFAGQLLSSFSKMFVAFFQKTGFTCALGNAILKNRIEKRRNKQLQKAEFLSIKATAKMLDLELHPNTQDNPRNLQEEKNRITEALSRRYRQDPDTGKIHDATVKGRMHELCSEIVKSCLPEGVAQPFRSNGLAIMTSTGAKGSFVNYSQISCLLGQQELEGRRVPRTVLGRTLPCFPPYDPGARAGGFIGDRFLTGLRPPEYYFHCMAGREGLVDTSVKTANSGYLQRCLVKCMESLRVMYDGSVRDDTDGSVCQFYYGEDGLDVTGSSYLNKFKFISENAEAFKRKLRIRAARRSSTLADLGDLEHKVKKYLKKRSKLLSDGGAIEELKKLDPVMSLYKPTLMGCMSETISDALWEYIIHNPDYLLHDQDESKLTPRDMDYIVKMKYMESLVSPGEAVGVLAAQSVGEPSTQMTLNTFHMAGRGEANVTLGIPRLREILMTASQNMKTPIMTLPLNVGLMESSAKTLAARLRKIRLAECMKGLYVEEYPITRLEGHSEDFGQVYRVGMEFHPMEDYPEEFKLQWSHLEDTFVAVFCPMVAAEIKKELKRYVNDEVILKAKVSQQTTDPEKEDEVEKGPKDHQYEDDEIDEANEEGRLQYRGGRSEKAYDAPDDEDSAFIKASMETLDARDLSNSDEEEETGSPGQKKSPKKKPTQQEEDQDTEMKKVKKLSHSSSNAVINKEALKCELVLSFPLNSPKLLMLNIAEHCATQTSIRKKEGIEKCYVVEAKSGSGYIVQTDGINFAAAWENSDLVDVDNIQCNDVASVLKTYGVEAARMIIVNECKGVFGAYGIEVNPRHLGLIADYMTNQGTYKGCNFYGIKCQSSPILKMSFERCTHFIREAALAGEYDPIRSPSARIAVGRPPLVGTGCMEIISYPPEQD